MRTRHYELGMVAHGQCPNLTVMTIEFLNVLELRKT
jgi:hypothetical protein